MQDNGGLNVEVGITLGKLLKQLQKAEANTYKTAKKMEQRFNKETAKSSSHFKRIDAAVGRSAMSVGRLGGILAGALSVRELQGFADAWTVATNKIAAAGEVAGRSGRSLSEINDIADATRSGITETADLYAKLLRATAGVAKSEKEVAKATELVNKAFKAGGAAASEQAAGILQLAQGLSSGILQGDELRSIRENAPLVAQAIADEFGVTIGALKELGANGELTADRVFQAILRAQPKIEAAFSKTNATIGEGFTRLRNAITEYVGGADQSVNATLKIGSALEFLAENIELAATAATLLAARFGGAAMGSLLVSVANKARVAAVALSGLSVSAGLATGGMVALRGAMALLGGPFGLALTAATALYFALDKMPSAQRQLEVSIDNVTTAMGDEIAQMNQLLALQPGSNLLTLEAAQLKLKEAEAIYAKLQADQASLEMMIRASEAYQSLTQEVSNYEAALNAIAEPGADLEEIPAHLRDSYAEMEALLASALNEQAALLSNATATKEELAEASENIAKWQAAIEDSKGGMVSLNGEVSTGVELSDRLSFLAGRVSFDSAAASAARLAAALGVSLKTAQRLAALGPQGVPTSEYVGGGRGGDPRKQGGSALDWQTREGTEFLKNYKKPSARGSGGGGGGKAQDPFFQNIEAQIESLTRQSEYFGKTKSEIAELTAKHKLLEEAKRRGLDLDARQSETGETLRDQIDAQAAAVGRLTDKYDAASKQTQFWEQQTSTMRDGLVDAIIEGENLSGVLENVAKSIAKAALEAALFNEGPLKDLFGAGGGLFSGGSGGSSKSGGGGFFGSLLGGFLGFEGGGYTGGGSRTGGVDGRGGFPAILHPNETVIDHTKGVPRSNSGSLAITVNVEGASGDQHIVGLVRQGVSEGMGQIRKEVPGIMSEHSKRVG